MTRIPAAVLVARKMLSDVTPLKTDCGVLCAGACCKGDDTTGMLLFPGEAALYEACDFGRVIPADFTLGGETARLFVCQGHCDREKRPLACRLFPLFCLFRPDGSACVRMDLRACEVCPLTEEGLDGLDADFLLAARKAYERLLCDPVCEAYLRDLSDAFTL